jgi:Glu-tRNA(Gln) amidotransferase subunit E-like FAD-binding protein
VAELKGFLQSRNLPTTGVKAELVKRLTTALEAEEENDADVDILNEEEVRFFARLMARSPAEEAVRGRDGIRSWC